MTKLIELIGLQGSQRQQEPAGEEALYPLLSAFVSFCQ